MRTIVIKSLFCLLFFSMGIKANHNNGQSCFTNAQAAIDYLSERCLKKAVFDAQTVIRDIAFGASRCQPVDIRQLCAKVCPRTSAAAILGVTYLKGKKIYNLCTDPDFN